jgi:hypothetical protein
MFTIARTKPAPETAAGFLIPGNFECATMPNILIRATSCVMAGLVPAIHAFGASAEKDVDARHVAGHDGSC